MHFVFYLGVAKPQISEVPFTRNWRRLCSIQGVCNLFRAIPVSLFWLSRASNRSSIHYWSLLAWRSAFRSLAIAAEYGFRLLLPHQFLVQG